MSGLKLILVALLGVLVSGCAMTYHEDGVQKLAPAEKAIIESDTAIDCMSACVAIFFVDGKHRGIGSFAKFELIPGYHEIGVMYIEPNGASVAESDNVLHLGFTAEAGHTYRTRANASLHRMDWHPEIFDKASGLGVSKIVRVSHDKSPF